MGEECARAEVKILTQNLFTPFLGANNKGERLEDFAKHAAGFDILLLQELFVFSFGFFGSGWKGWMIARLKQEGFQYHVASPEPVVGQCSGLIIFSKFPLDPFNHTDFIKFYNWRGREAWTAKGALRAKVKVDPSLPPLVCVVTHLQCDGGPENTQTRIQQISQMKTYLLQKHTNYVVCGDFNICAINEPDAYQQMKSMLGPVRDVLLEEATNTVRPFGDDASSSPVDLSLRPVTCPNTNKPLESLDYAWLRVPAPSELESKDKKKRKLPAVWDYVAGSAQVEKLPVSDPSWGVREGTLSDHFGVSFKIAAVSA